MDRLARSLAACAALLFAASSVGAASYTLAGKFTSNRGQDVQVPVIGATGCGGLTFMSGPKVVGTLTPPTHPNMVGINHRNGMDAGCMPHAPGGVVPGVGKKVVTAGMGVGGQLTIPIGAFFQPGPMTTINAISVMTIPGVLQFATSNSVTGPPAVRLEAPMGTMNNGTNTAAFRVFKQGAWATQTGRAAAKFTWCPPLTVSGVGGPCTKIGQGGVPEIIKYNGTASSFGGTMSYVTHAIGVGSLVRNVGGAGAVYPFAMESSQPTGRGYAEQHIEMLLAANVYATHMEMFVIRPIVGTQKLVTMLGPLVGMAGHLVVNWGFPLTTRTVLVRRTDTLGSLPDGSTFTAMGYDCVNAKGPMCSVVTGMNHRNISLVAGAVGVGVHPPPIGNVPTIALVHAWLPEPGATLQLLAGVIAMLGIAVWRARKVR